MPRRSRRGVESEQWCGWIRRIGGAALKPRGWQRVTSADTAAECWHATEEARHADEPYRRWAIVEWTVLPAGQHPQRALRPPSRRRAVPA
jgi:hypothetical protein